MLLLCHLSIKRYSIKKLTFKDLEAIDQNSYKSLKWLLDSEDAETLAYTFTWDYDDCFNNKKHVELKPGGENIIVTNENKKEFVDLVTELIIYDGIKDQLESLKEGFYEILSKERFENLDEKDLKLLIYGIKDIDIEDWKSKAEYEHYRSNDPTIVHFWKCVSEFDSIMKARLLQFIYGIYHISLPNYFTIKKYGTPDNLPEGHFRQIYLPPYTSYEQLKEKLTLAIKKS